MLLGVVDLELLRRYVSKIVGGYRVLAARMSLRGGDHKIAWHNKLARVINDAVDIDFHDRPLFITCFLRHH